MLKTSDFFIVVKFKTIRETTIAMHILQLHAYKSYHKKGRKVIILCL